MNIKEVFSRVAKPLMKILPLVFLSEIKIDLSNSIVPACLLGIILELKNSLKFHFDKQFSRNLLRKNAYRRLRQRDIVCIQNVTLPPLVMSLML